MFANRFSFLMVFLGLGMGFSSLVQADVYKCSTDNGSVTLSNVEKGPNCKKMDLPAAQAKKPQAPKADEEKSEKSKKTDKSDKSSTSEAKPAEKPKNTFESAAADRKRIIQEEIDLEKSRLGVVQSRIKDLNALSKLSADQSKDLAALQQKEKLHTKNLQLLQKEFNK